MLSDQEFVRYQRQIALPEIGETGQRDLNNAHVLIIGCGGLGSAASLYLASAGVGKLVIVDDDKVEASNLQRQIIYRQNQIGQLKTTAASDQLLAVNPDTRIRTLDKRMDKPQLELEVMLADVVLDCSDNMPTRQMVNQVCFEQNTPLITAAAIGWQGQFSVFDYRDGESKANACYRCLFPFNELKQASKCSDSGVLGPVVGTLGNYQAIAAIQLLATGQFIVATEMLHLFNGLTLEWKTLAISQDSHCSVCGTSEQDANYLCENPL